MRDVPYLDRFELNETKIAHRGFCRQKHPAVRGYHEPPGAFVQTGGDRSKRFAGVKTFRQPPYFLAVTELVFKPEFA